jgi:hypothetical protein
MKLLNIWYRLSKKKKIQVGLLLAIVLILIGIAIWKVVGLLAEGEPITNTATMTYNDGTGIQTVTSNSVQTGVLSGAVPKIDIKASGNDGPLTVDYGTELIISWGATDADTCIASGDWSGEKPILGSEATGELTSSKTYTLTCTGTGGSDEDSIVINVTALDQPIEEPGSEPGEAPGLIERVVAKVKAAPTGAIALLYLIVASVILSMICLIYIIRRPSKNIPPTSET